MKSQRPSVAAIKDEKKMAHSAMERRYRLELNNTINELRALVPACAHANNPNKVAVLKMTSEYIQEVHDHEVMFFFLSFFTPLSCLFSDAH